MTAFEAAHLLAFGTRYTLNHYAGEANRRFRAGELVVPRGVGADDLTDAIEKGPVGRLVALYLSQNAPSLHPANATHVAVGYQIEAYAGVLTEAGRTGHLDFLATYRGSRVGRIPRDVFFEQKVWPYWNQVGPDFQNLQIDRRQAFFAQSAGPPVYAPPPSGPAAVPGGPTAFKRYVFERDKVAQAVATARARTKQAAAEAMVQLYAAEGGKPKAPGSVITYWGTFDPFSGEEA